MFYYLITTIIFSLLTMFLSGHLALKFYKESIKAKSELREEIIYEIRNENKSIYSIEYVESLEDNAKMLQEYIKTNPDKSQDLLSFKKGYDARKKK